MQIVYNCGYYTTLDKVGKVTRRKYFFKKRYVTEVEDADAQELLKLTSKDIAWCDDEPKNVPPFMELEAWCLGEEGRFDSKPYKIYDPEEYKKLFLLK